MPQPKNSMEIFKYLPKTNCRECRVPTCLAFSVLVMKGEKKLDECPYLERQVIERFGNTIEKRKTAEEDMEELMAELKTKITAVDLSSLADKLGGKYSRGRLTIKVLGKDVSVDEKGKIITDIHVHSWLAMPVYNYIIDGSATPVSGKWVPFRELKGGKNWYRLFGQRCEKPLKKIADTYTDLFEDMIHLFNGKQVENHYASDISLVLSPLPKMPILICYWKPEDGLESNLNLFFDSSAEEILNIESIYALGTGLVTMFEKLAVRHGLK
jgi:hypothetical protein